MKIDNRISDYMALLNSSTVKPGTQSAHATESPTTPGAASSEVAISPSAVQLAEDNARRERLNAIRQQLAEGSYNISGKDVADKMLNVLKG